MAIAVVIKLFLCKRKTSLSHCVHGKYAFRFIICVDLSKEPFSMRPYYHFIVRPYKEISCFPSQRASIFKSASRKFLIFISLNLMSSALKLIVFR